MQEIHLCQPNSSRKGTDGLKIDPLTHTKKDRADRAGTHVSKSHLVSDRVTVIYDVKSGTSVKSAFETSSSTRAASDLPSGHRYA